MTYETKKTRVPPLVATALLVLAAAAAMIPANAGAIDPPPEEDSSGRFFLDVSDFEAVGNFGNWVVDGTSQTAGQTHGNARPAMLVHDDGLRDVTFRVDLQTPSLENGLLGFLIHHKAPEAGDDFYDTIVVDWLAHNSALGGRDATEGFTMYHIKGTVSTHAEFLDCFWAKDPVACPAQISVLSTYVADERPHTAERGWRADQEYQFKLRFWGDNFPSQSGVKVAVRGGADSDDNPYNPPHPGLSDWTRDVLEVGAYQLDPAGFGFYSFRQAGAIWSEPYFVDDRQPTLKVDTTCLDPAAGGWCHGPVRVQIDEAFDLGSGLANITCSVSGVVEEGCWADPFASFDVSEHDAQLRIVAKDHAGNQKVFQSDLRIDTEAPELDVSATCLGDEVAGWCNGDVRLQAGASALSGIVSLECTLDGGSTSCSQDLDTDGDFVFEAMATSRMGHSTTESVAFSRESTGPTGAIVDPVPGCFYQNDEPGPCLGVSVVSGNVSVKVVASDPEVNSVSAGMDRVEFHDNDGLFATIGGDGADGWYNATWSPAPGDQLLQVHLIDQAGNTDVLEYEALAIPVGGPSPPSPPPLPPIPDPPTAGASVSGSATNNGDNAGNLSTSGGGSIDVSVGPDGPDVQHSDPAGMADGVQAYVGFLTGGFNGTAGLQGQVFAGDASCSFQTWGGDEELPIYGTVPEAGCD